VVACLPTTGEAEIGGSSRPAYAKIWDPIKKITKVKWAEVWLKYRAPAYQVGGP
jgi:hypothetical protein